MPRIVETDKKFYGKKILKITLKGSEAKGQK